jgi:hypothetical protein
MTNSFKQFLYESNNFDIQFAIDNKDDVLVNDLVNKLSILYKKRVERYLRPTKFVGVMGDSIELRIHMSNKDIVLFTYKDNELKITINGDVVYHMDDIDKKDIAEKVLKYYEKYIENQNFKVVKRGNPFK